MQAVARRSSIRRGKVMVGDDAIYTRLSLGTIPHRIRVRQVIRELRAMPFKSLSYADVGCGGGSITYRITEAIKPARATGFDSNPDLIHAGGNLFPTISFRVWDLTRENLTGEKFDLVTCLETLEHVEDCQAALVNLLRITSGTLLITVPIELGLLGAAKFSAKLLLGRRPLSEEHAGSHWEYLKTVLTNGEISRFRVRSRNGFFVSHTGFDYRKLDSLLTFLKVDYIANNRGWNRFYRINRQPVHSHVMRDSLLQP